MRTIFKNIALSIIHSYSIVLFSQNIIFGIILFIVTFFNYNAGFTGLMAVVFAIIFSKLIGLNEEEIATGLYSFNALLVGIGFGVHYIINIPFISILALLTLFSVLFSIALKSFLEKHGLPFLSIPFCIVSWLILLSIGSFLNIEPLINQRFHLYQLSSFNNNPIANLIFYFEKYSGSNFISIYLRALSTIFFQDNILIGLLISIGLLLHSRIAFTLSLLGIAFAFLCNYLFGIQFNPANMNMFWCNYILTAIAVGCFFIIPSVRSYLLALISVPINTIFMLSFGKLFNFVSLPMFFLSFCLTTIFLLYVISVMNKNKGTRPKKFIFPSYQFYSPELNLYHYTINNERRDASRIKNSQWLPFELPVIGEWFVSQGHNGELTHKGEWSYGLDFILIDEEMKSYSSNGTNVQQYYCYDKPVIASADGVIEQVIDNIDDNDIGDVNTLNNWGNSVIIKHQEGLYSKLSHLKKNSFKVKPGDYIKKGDIIATCGNSGRSPEPHLHLQFQAEPGVDAKSIIYPFSLFMLKNPSGVSFKSNEIPNEGETVFNIEPNSFLKSAFNFQPGNILKFKSSEHGKEIFESWEVFTDIWNQSYIYCKETQSTAYFNYDGTMFYFTNFYGDKKSILYNFWLGAYKIVLAFYENLEIQDNYSLSIIDNILVRWLQDFLSPFYKFIKPVYKLKYSEFHNQFSYSKIKLESSFSIKTFKENKLKGTSPKKKFEIIIENGKIKEFIYTKETGSKWNKEVRAECVQA
ncbi:MAG: urea transporter [FCB group bacterium]|jgi:urea transporter